MKATLIAPPHLRSLHNGSSPAELLDERREWARGQYRDGRSSIEIRQALGSSRWVIQQMLKVPPAAKSLPPADSPRPKPLPDDRMRMAIPSAAYSSTTDATAFVSLKRGPFDAKDCRPDARPETNPRFTLVKYGKPRRPAQPSVLAVIAAIRNELEAMA